MGQSTENGRIRIGFIGSITHEQAGVIWSVRDRLAFYGVDLIHAHSDANTVATPGGNEFDLLLIHSPHWDARYLDGPTPIVILERIDGAQLSGSVRKAATRDNVKLIIKNTVYYLPRWYQATNWRPHEYMCRRAFEPFGDFGDQFKGTDPAFAAIVYQKLKCGFSFAAYPRLERYVNINPSTMSFAHPWRNRPIDVHFAGTVDYAYDDESQVAWLTKHRRAAVDAIQALSPRYAVRVSDHRSFDADQYHRDLLQTKIVVSPWGLGEACWRDFEGALSGCLVIKPSTDHVQTVPSRFYEHLVDCKPDFSDLREKVDLILDPAQNFCGVTDGFREWILHHNSPEKIAWRLTGLFRKALGKPVYI